MISTIYKTKKSFFCLVVICSFMNVSNGLSDTKIATGETGGTYYMVGNDLKKIGVLDNDDISLINTPGSIANLILLKENNVSYAFAQLDSVNIFSKYIDKTFFLKFNILLKMYPEDVHIISNFSYNNIQGLANKKVSCGRKNSGSCITLDLISHHYGVKFKKIYTDIKNAFEMLSLKNLDAIVITGGQPLNIIHKMFNKYKNLKFITLERNDSMINTSGYKDSFIRKSSYDFIPDDIPTLSVYSVLIGKKINSKSESSFAEKICGKIEYLIQNGHAVWKDVKKHCK